MGHANRLRLFVYSALVIACFGLSSLGANKHTPASAPANGHMHLGNGGPPLKTLPSTPLALAPRSTNQNASSDALDVVRFFDSVFTIVLALAMGEAFKQFVSDKAERPEDRTIHWNRLPALITFLVTIVPFFEGMSRYFYVNYQHVDRMTQLYPKILMLDGAAFLAESSLFFILSRALSPTQLGRVIGTLFFLFSIDFVRELLDFVYPLHRLGPWTYQNIVAMVVLAVMYLLYRATYRWIFHPRGGLFNYTAAIVASSILTILAVFRTILDYYFTWGFYFPPAT